MIPSAQIESRHHVDQSHWHSSHQPRFSQRAELPLSSMVVQQHRSLLQYADLCWPWVDLQESTERRILKSLAARQREGIREIVRELDRRDWPVDYGQFPTEYADLNFAALDHLWPRIVKAEECLLAKLHEVRQNVADDSDAVRVIDQCVKNQREILHTVSEHEVAEAFCDSETSHRRKKSP